MPLIGPTIIAGRYQIQAPLGGGHQGDVYRVRDLHEGDIVALKLIRRVATGGLWTEAQILRRLSDPHILPIRNADVASGQPYLVTDLAEHGTLENRLTGAGARGLEVDEVIRWIRHAAYGIARAHQLRLTHNDVKPANLFLNAEAECMVGDFGMAALITPGAASVRPPGGTPETAAPEVAAGWGTTAATASEQSDVYSLGATAFWLLAARPQLDFTGVGDIAAKMAIVAASTPPRLRDLAPHVPLYVARVIETAMARNPAARFASATQFAASLGARPVPARRWQRTDEHSGHMACWRGEPSRGSTYVLCLETGSRPSQCLITTRRASSGQRVTAGCRVVPCRNWAQGVRAVMQQIG